MSTAVPFPVNAYRLVSFLYLILIAVFAFWPFRFVPPCLTPSMGWTPDTPGIRLSRCSVLSSPSPNESLYRSFRDARGISVEAAVQAETLHQGGPARIISYSMDPEHSNFVLGQESDALVFRLRTTQTNLNGSKPAFIAPGVFDTSRRQHITVTYDGTVQKFFLDGKPLASSDELKGRLTHWDPGHFLIFGNELTGNRPWTGTIYLAALYNRALEDREVMENYLSADGRGRRIEAGLAGFYRFSEGSGDAVSDESPGKTAGVLRAARFRTFRESLFSGFSRRFYLNDMVVNVIGFLPLGFFIFCHLPVKRRSVVWSVYALPIAVGGLLSSSIEFIQQYTVTRNTNAWDILYNILGTGIGCLFLHGWRARKDVRTNPPGMVADRHGPSA